ncbi:MAG: phosphotransferase family protein [Acidimicrobiales bacterium]
MEPEPETYLMGARRELLDLAPTLPRPTSIVVQRIAELLAQLAVRRTVLDALDDLTAEQRRLFDETVRAAKAAGVLADPSLGAVAPDYESLVHAQARLIRLLLAGNRSPQPSIADHAPLLRASIAIEARAQAILRARLDACKEADDARPRSLDEEQRNVPTEDELADYLASRFPDHPRPVVTDLSQHAGLNSKDILFFRQLGCPTWPERVVIRRLRAIRDEQATMQLEFALLGTLRGHGLPVPRPLLLEATGRPLHQPFLMLEQVRGETEPAAALGERGPSIARQIAELMARAHAIDPDVVAQDSEAGVPAHELVTRRIAHFYDVWKENQVEGSSTIESGFAWALANVEHLEEISVLVHGDCELRNFLIEGDEVSAFLDWERAHLGHPAEDLAYCRVDIEKLMPWPEFLDHYRASGGASVSSRSMHFFSIWRCLFQVAVCAEVHNSYRRGRHRDYLIGSVGYLEYRDQVDALAGLLQGGEW